MRRLLLSVVALSSIAACASTGAETVVRDDAADRLKCHPREILVSSREDMGLGTYEATGCGGTAIFKCHDGAAGIVDCTPDMASTEPALGVPGNGPLAHAVPAH
jgi:hypothetical protein